ncbi:MAG: ABC transporter ATP-binding protein [Pelagibacteraceae bacterium]|nr:ABC transporter ATP-binding protein [Pelagibacteraceae bacterium]PHX88901.1 MAG: nitrate/sulfonate/bicarbonate ABC transporter ATP-binding protein [Pelagibacteraceae bacterium]
MAKLIQVTNLKKIFENGSETVHAFGPLSVDINIGEFVTILGPSGCGKSTLMLIIAGLLESTSGKVEFENKLVEGPKTDIGIMFQNNTLVPWRTVKGNIELQLELRKLSLEDYEDKVNDILKSVNLEDFAHRYPNELSGGMQQRAAFCQAMIHEPKIILLDEPLGKLDAMTREKIRADFQKLWMIKKPTVIFVTHSIEEAVQLSSRIILITPRPGKIDREMKIDLPYPRDLKLKRSAKFMEYVNSIEEVFHEYGVI